MIGTTTDVGNKLINIEGSARVKDTIFSARANLSGLTASYLVGTDGSKNLVSIDPTSLSGLPYIGITGTSTATGAINLSMGSNAFEITRASGSGAINFFTGDDASKPHLMLDPASSIAELGVEQTKIILDETSGLQRIFLKGGIRSNYTLETSDADVTITGTTSFVKISGWTTDRNIILPDATINENDGLEITVWNTSNDYGGTFDQNYQIGDLSTNNEIQRRTIMKLKVIDGSWVRLSAQNP